MDIGWSEGVNHAYYDYDKYIPQLKIEIAPCSVHDDVNRVMTNSAILWFLRMDCHNYVGDYWRHYIEPIRVCFSDLGTTEICILFEQLGMQWCFKSTGYFSITLKRAMLFRFQKKLALDKIDS